MQEIKLLCLDLRIPEYLTAASLHNYGAKLDSRTKQQKSEVQNQVDDSEDSVCISEEISDNDKLEIRKGRKRWTETEKNIVVTEFAKYIKKGKNPGTIKCRQLLEKNGNLLQGRTPNQINSFVDNINKGKVKLPPCFSYLQKS